MPNPTLIEVKRWVQTQVGNKRLKHIQGVCQTAAKLAKRNGLSVYKSQLASWMHDCAKELPKEVMKSWLQRSSIKLDRDETALPALWHPHASAAIAKIKWGIRDKEILEAIECHTLGKPGMGPLAQIVFVADFIEPGRDFPGIDQARRISRVSLRDGVLLKASMTVEFLFKRHAKVHPRLLETWNYFLNKEIHEIH